ncbi:hypothetical protein [Streptomyces sp. NPDC018031]|uniref:hypothetical protein n=1 Tax=Streptomyces sp. NPDC018031 TaxID=3365033 RepID=UPI003787F5AC
MSFGHGGPAGPGGQYGPGGQQGPGGRQYGPQGPQQGPAGGPPGSTPDWAALADDTARRGRRRRLLLVGGGVLATGAVAAIVATAVVSSDGGGSGTSGSASGLPAPEKLPSGSPTPEPTFSDVAPPPPPNPTDILSDKAKDKAPLSAGTLFTDGKVVSNGRSYTKGPTGSTDSCASAAQGRLAGVLRENGCRRMFRATYTRDGMAITVGIAVFDTKAAAEQAKRQAGPNVASLSGGKVPTFCRRTGCASSSNAFGRYAYFTVSGYTSGKRVTKGDDKVWQAGRDVSDYAFGRILARGKAQAAAIASANAKLPENA